MITTFLDVSVASEFKDPLVALVVGNKADLREDKSRTDLLSSIEIQRITSVLDNVQYQEVSTVRIYQYFTFFILYYRQEYL